MKTFIVKKVRTGLFSSRYELHQIRFETEVKRTKNSISSAGGSWQTVVLRPGDIVEAEVKHIHYAP